MILCKEILVAEDNDDTRELLVQILEHNGYNVRSASNGLEALRKLNHMPEPSLVLLDMMMPLMSGWNMLKEKHSRAHRIVSISAIDSETQQELIETGSICDQLQKPIFATDLLRLVKKYCGDPPSLELRP